MRPETEERLLEKVGSIDAKVETLLQHAEKHDKRIAAIERKIWWGSGAVGAVVAVVTPKLRAIVGI